MHMEQMHMNMMPQISLPMFLALFKNNYTLNGYGIDGLCKIMRNPQESAVEGVAGVYFWATNEGNNGIPINILDNNYDNSMAQLNRTSFNLSNPIDRDGTAASRGWMWLSCGMALGWLQSTDSSKNIFNRAVPLEFVTVSNYI
uniref:Uncharacterized protein n=1 Tax=Panagrolaimus superbus TaxID=310955 RepID=A0A914XZ23_9BILA